MKKQPTPEQKEAARLRREAARIIAKQIADMPPAERIALSQRCPVVSITGNVFSPVNQCMIALQYPAATLCGGFAQWIAHGRSVKKGEHGLSIWVPLKGKGSDEAPAEPTPAEMTDSTTEPTRRRFILGSVFDVSQTQEIPPREKAA